MKKCTKCNKTKPISEFHISQGFKDKHNNWCKNCMKIYHQIYRKNPRVRQQELILGRIYFLNNREKCLLKSKKWKIKNRSKLNEYQKNIYLIVY